MSDDNVTRYDAPQSLQGFLTSESFVSLVCGPVGSGKSSAAMLKIAYHASRMRKQKDGIRRSRVVVIRNTDDMLKTATIETLFTWFPQDIAGTYLKTEKKFILRFDDVLCEILFRGLDDTNDVRRLLSLEVSFAVLDEFREINPDIFNAVQARVGRYPSMKDGGCVTDDGKSNRHVWGATNPPDDLSFWSEYMDNPPENASIFKQPSARSPQADWLDNLPVDYYDDIMQGKTEDWIAVYVDNKFGRSLSGEPVFGKSFDTERHTAAQLNVLSSPLIIGVDAGLTPAAVIGQLDYQSRLIIHDAITGESMGALRFVREKLKPLLANKFAGRPSVIVIDPAAFQRAQTDERTVADIYKAEGFKVIPARTNAIAARIAAVESYLTRTVDGKPCMLIDKTSASSLVLALRSKYRYKINTKGQREETPEKSHPHSDLCDAMQYVSMHADNGATFGAHRATTRVEIKPAPRYAYV
jgi:hypothetical protein